MAAEDHEQIRSFLEQYCIECHGGEKVKGKVDFREALSSKETLGEQFEFWENVRDVLEFEEMPPEDELQPDDAARATFSTWYQQHFVDSVESKPGEFEPRRLSVHEYRNTLRSLFGFDLEVAVMEAEQTVSEKSLVLKLLPTDPPGASGFTNDTHSNPLTTVVWDQYSYLTENGLEELFSPHRRSALEVYTGPIEKSGLTEEQASRLIQEFAKRAWRRNVPASEIDPFLPGIKGLKGKALIVALKKELKAILMSPRFLYRGLLVEGTPGGQEQVDAHELAERLSYFLWSDMPDAELFRLAESGQLREEKTLADEINRMLDHSASRVLAEHFAAQWLTLNEIEHVSNNPPVRDALLSQAIDYMDYLFREDRPLIELIDSQTTFINPHTAKYYPRDRKQMASYKKQKGIEVESVPNQRITLDQDAEGRGGLLTMPGVLAMNKGPVIRGTWMLERILGDHLGDPPADVGQVQANAKGENLSFRERFEAHRSDATCAVCHDKIDPLGFALQAYDDQGGYLFSKAAINAAKKKKNKSKPIDPESLDTSGRLPTGESFTNFAELKQILVTSQRRAVVRNIVERTLSYALCRKLEIYDQPTIEEITDSLEGEHATYRKLVKEVVFSLPFRETCFPTPKS